MKQQNTNLYKIYKKSERLYKLGVLSFSTCLRIRGLYHSSIRPKPKNSD